MALRPRSDQALNATAEQESPRFVAERSSWLRGHEASRSLSEADESARSASRSTKVRHGWTWFLNGFGPLREAVPQLEAEGISRPSDAARFQDALDSARARQGKPQMGDPDAPSQGEELEGAVTKAFMHQLAHQEQREEAMTEAFKRKLTDEQGRSTRDKIIEWLKVMVLAFIAVAFCTVLTLLVIAAIEDKPQHFEPLWHLAVAFGSAGSGFVGGVIALRGGPRLRARVPAPERLSEAVDEPFAERREVS